MGANIQNANSPHRFLLILTKLYDKYISHRRRRVVRVCVCVCVCGGGGVIGDYLWAICQIKQKQITDMTL